MEDLGNLGGGGGGGRQNARFEKFEGISRGYKVTNQV